MHHKFKITIHIIYFLFKQDNKIITSLRGREVRIKKSEEKLFCLSTLTLYINYIFFYFFFHVFFF